MANLLAWLLISYWAIRLAPGYGWLMAQASLLPMCVSLGASVNPDALALGLAFLFVALVLRSTEDAEEAAATVHVAALALLFPVMALCKGYVLLWLVLLISPRLWKRPAFRLALLISLGVTILLLLEWFRAVQETLVPTAPWSNDWRQVAFILEQPAKAARVILRAIWKNGLNIRGMIGILGWLDVRLYGPMYAVYGALLVLVPVLLVARTRVGIRGKVIIAVAAALMVVVIYTRLYIICSRVGSHRVLGIQGRYFLPMLPAALLLLCHNAWPGLKARVRPYVPAAWTAINLILLALATLRVVDRYYRP
jgi:uncharacterized membrane protein